MLLRAQQKSRINDLVIKGGTVQNDTEEPQEAELDDIAALLLDEDDDSIDIVRASAAASQAAEKLRSTEAVGDHHPVMLSADIRGAFGPVKAKKPAVTLKMMPSI